MHYVQATFLDQIYILGSGYNFFGKVFCQHFNHIYLLQNLREAPLQLHDSRVQKNVS